MSFHSRQATWQALQPMHFEVSMSFATSVWRCAGGVMVEAERRMRSCSPNFGGTGWTDGFGSGGNIAASLYHRPGNGLDIDQERLEFRRFGVGIAHIGRERIGPEPLLGDAHEAPMERNADDVHRLAVACDGDDALGDDSFRFHRTAVRPHPHPAARLDALKLREFLADLDEELGLH